MKENFCKLNITALSSEQVKCFEFIPDENTLIRDLFNKAQKVLFDNDYYLEDSEMLSCFWFIRYGKKQKAIPSYNLIEFLDNFNYCEKNIVIYAGELCGKGGDFTIDKTIKIQINANEPRHNNPHVHVTRPYSHNSNFYRIDINTLTQMKGDKENWIKEFSLRERKTIIKCIKNNKEILIDYYDRNRKGEYIDHNYYIEHNGRKLLIK